MAQKVTKAKVAEAIRGKRGLLTAVADQLGVDRKQIYRWLERWPDLNNVLDEARDRTTDIAEAALYRALLNGERWAVQFYLKTQGRTRGYVERQEIAGADGSPWHVTVERRVVTPDRNDDGK